MNKVLPIILVLAVITLTTVQFAEGAVGWKGFLKEIGLKKVPQKGAVETNAAYFYNQVKFKQV